jgi:hypothetical protein
MSDPSVVIVILTYNSAPHIRECLASLALLDYSNFEIVVVDNASTDDTVSLARTDTLAPTVIVNETNLGYAEGNNVGLRYALSANADYVLVLNDDVIVARDLLTQLVRAAQANPHAALLGPIVYHYSAPEVIQSAGGALGSWTFPHRGINEPDRGQFNRVESVAWLSGCAILASCQALKTIGLFDPDFFMYWEDVDWCLRAQKAGYQVLLVPQAKLWHKGVQISYAPSPRVAYYMARNELYLLAKHHANLIVQIKSWFKYIRTIVSYTVRPRWKNKRAHRNAQVKALLHVLTRRFGSLVIE